MSYNTQEISAAAGQPVELYRFVLGQQVWTVTSGREAITYQVESYQPAVIRRSAVEQSPEFARNGIDLECARDFAVAQLFAAARPNGVVSLTVFRNHFGDSEYITWWKGRVASVVFAGSTAKIRCESIFTALKRPGLRAHYQTGCRHALFDPGCGVNNQAYKLAGTVASFSGLNVTSSTFLSQASGWLTGGYLRVAGVPRMITNHSGDSITLSASLDSRQEPLRRGFHRLRAHHVGTDRDLGHHHGHRHAACAEAAQAGFRDAGQSRRAGGGIRQTHPGAVRHPGHPASQRGLVRRRQDHRDPPIVRQRRQEMIVTHDDAKAFGYCNAGLRKWFPRDGVSFDDFRQHGVTVEWLRATGDAMAARLADEVERQRQSQEVT